ncbi:glycoside hydrolase family 127 protein [Occultella glacieicola]|uniref:glycoside hydrolase family 127 protein n=1 Tax=Occultella glacieicola TaxID=2518684 RepID=UPI001F2B29BB|nr:beta-L-arabinofuranosidase domain-containing protein [Occultella glacieicola]
MTTQAVPAGSVQPGSVAPAVPTGPVAVQRPLDLRAVRLDPSGRLGAWQDLNATATIPHCIDQLEASGVLDNFRRLVSESDAAHRGFVFADSDLYKVIEAVAWEIGRSGTDRWDAWLDDVIALVARAQDETGYVMTWIQGVHPEKRFAELEWTHEMYVLGHLVQAAVALDRAAGRTDLLAIAERFVALVQRTFGPGGTDGICGHPEIETALVELYRHTGDRAHLDLAQRMVDLRGRGLLKVGSLGARYFQDHAPVREATAAVGHAVRQLYLNAGVTDLYLETGEAALLDAMDAQWASAHERKMYLSGAFGARHRDEAFGDDYELPSERAYAETCATIADLHWTWRMTLARGGSAYAETIEREIHNALAASVDAGGTRFFYSNPLQLRPDRYSEENSPRERTSWYACACCPPNIARVVAQLSAYVASSTDDELLVHQFAAAEIDLPAHLGQGTLLVETDYPRTGAVALSVRGSVRPGARLAVRIPGWSAGSPLVAVMPDGGPAAGSGSVAEADGYARVDLADGARYRLDLDLTPRWTTGHPRVDAVRGCIALERGPVVYCVEQADLTGPAEVDDLSVVVTQAPREVTAADGGTRLELAARLSEPPTELYRTAEGEPAPSGTTTVTAIPFATWGNRAPGAMRVWLPVARD